MVNMMTGIAAPTHGHIFANGLDIEDDVAEVQQIVSVCPQDDLLWDNLTAWEHLQMYAALKGLGNIGDQAATSLLKRVQLDHRQHAVSCTFSGGMRRRLSLALSCIGDDILLLLDELLQVWTN